MSIKIAWNKVPVKRLSALPSIEQPYFTGAPTYLGTPNFGQLRQEIRDFAYALWERHGWDETTCWLRAETSLFFGFEEVGYSGVGYRIFSQEDERPHWEHDGPSFDVKIITPDFPIMFQITDGVIPARQECKPITLCSAMKRVESRKECPDTL